jgi:hypothetical protein
LVSFRLLATQGTRQYGIEAQLAHVESNAVRKAYARAEYWAERVEMMVYWADRQDELRQGGVVVPLRA